MGRNASRPGPWSSTKTAVRRWAWRPAPAASPPPAASWRTRPRLRCPTRTRPGRGTVLTGTMQLPLRVAATPRRRTWVRRPRRAKQQARRLVCPQALATRRRLHPLRRGRRSYQHRGFVFKLPGSGLTGGAAWAKHGKTFNNQHRVGAIVLPFTRTAVSI